MRLPADNGVGYNSDGPYKGRPPNESILTDGVSAQYIPSGISPGLRALVRDSRAALDFLLRGG